MGMNAIIFPGQGSQYKGMGVSLYENFPRAKELFEKINKIAGLNIYELCLNAKVEDLKNTYFQQQVILATSLVAYEIFKEKDVKIEFLSGLSLGEYTCLYPAQALDLESLVLLIQERAAAMEEASQENPSSMFAVIGIDAQSLRELATSNGFYLSNFNAPGQIAISLKKTDREQIRQLLESKGARVVELEVAGGFHSPFMEPARRHLSRVLSQLDFNDAKIPIVSNFTGRPSCDRLEIKHNLENQLTSAVLWKDCVEFMIKAGVDTFFEVGPSKILRGLIRKINPEVKIINIEKKEDLDSLQ
jgi:[acyl-carrier-protein] S-malonyltransferase